MVVRWWLFTAIVVLVVLGGIVVAVTAFPTSTATGGGCGRCNKVVWPAIRSSRAIASLIEARSSLHPIHTETDGLEAGWTSRCTTRGWGFASGGGTERYLELPVACLVGHNPASRTATLA